MKYCLKHQIDVRQVVFMQMICSNDKRIYFRIFEENHYRMAEFFVSQPEHGSYVRDSVLCVFTISVSFMFCL